MRVKANGEKRHAAYTLMAWRSLSTPLLKGLSPAKLIELADGRAEPG